MKVLLFFLVMGLCGFLHAELTNSTGFPFFENYSPDHYNRSAQNFQILQTKDGLIYAANNSGLLEFDGVNWRAVDVPNRTSRSIVVDQNGVIYIGGHNTIGMISPGETAAPEFQSLVKFLPDHVKNFKLVWQTCQEDGKIFFRTSDYLIRWDPGPEKNARLGKAKQW